TARDIWRFRFGCRLPLSISKRSRSRSCRPPPPAVAPFDAKKAKEHQGTWANHLGVPVEIENSLGMKLRLIPPGEFLMGSSPEQIARFEKIADEWARAGIRREGPQKKKTISEPFYLGAHEVTVGNSALLSKRRDTRPRTKPT